MSTFVVLNQNTLSALEARTFKNILTPPNHWV